MNLYDMTLTYSALEIPKVINKGTAIEYMYTDEDGINRKHVDFFPEGSWRLLSWNGAKEIFVEKVHEIGVVSENHVRNLIAELNKNANPDKAYITQYYLGTKQVYNPEYGDNRTCVCGHKYIDHFSNERAGSVIGCRECSCSSFKL